MSWQNQLLSPPSNQPGPQVAGQPEFPFPGQLDTQAQAPIPPAVYQAARVAGLGTPLQEYSKPSGSSGSASLPGMDVARSTTGIGLAVGVLSAIGATILILLVVPSPLNWIIASSTLALMVVCTLPFIKMIGGMIGFLRPSGSTGGDLRFWSCADGLAYMQGEHIQTVRWSDIAQVWRKSALVNGILITIGYLVQPANGPQFSFSLLSGPYANLMNAFGGADGVSISSGAGEMSSSGGFTEISGYIDLSAYRGLGELIEDQMVRQQLPHALESYQRGNVVSFGPLSIHPQGLSDGLNELTWNEIADIQVSPAAVQISKKPAGLVWFTLNASAIPNMALLVAVLKTIQRLLLVDGIQPFIPGINKNFTEHKRMYYGE